MTLPEDGFVQDGRKHLFGTLDRANHTIEIPVNPDRDVFIPLLAALENVIILAWTVITVRECELSKKNREATINRIEGDLRAAKEKYENYCAIRRENREFARLQAKKHREILAQVEAELNLPKSLRRYAKKAMDEE